MNYERKYKEALAHAREIHRNEVDKRHDMEWLFPELKESENEKIKKVLIDYFNRYKEQEECGITTFFGIPTDNIITWLEKQGKQKLEWYEEDKLIIEDIIGYFQSERDITTDEEYIIDLDKYCRLLQRVKKSME